MRYLNVVCTLKILPRHRPHSKLDHTASLALIVRVAFCFGPLLPTFGLSIAEKRGGFAQGDWLARQSSSQTF